MADLLINLVSLGLIAFAVYDWRTAIRLIKAAWPRPRIPALTSSMWDRVGVAVGASAIALLGVSRLIAVATGPGTTIVPPLVGFTLLIIGVVAPSLPNIPKNRQIGIWMKRYREDQHPQRREGP